MKKGNLIHHGPPVVDKAAQSFWSFRPVARPAVPAVKDKAWVRNPIDAFVLAKLEEKGLRPAPPASSAALFAGFTFSGDRPATDAGGGGRICACLLSVALSLRHSVGRSGGKDGGTERQGECHLQRARGEAARFARTTASTGAGTGSTWSAMPRPTASNATIPSRSPGAIAIMSSARSTTTSRTTSSSASNWPATSWTK